MLECKRCGSTTLRFDPIAPEQRANKVWQRGDGLIVMGSLPFTYTCGECGQLDQVMRPYDWEPPAGPPAPVKSE